MQSDDSHVNSINLLSSIVSTTRIPILFPSDYEVWALNFGDYVLGLEDNGSLIWDVITKEAFAHTGTKRVIKTQAEYNTLLLDVENIAQEEKDNLISDVKDMRIIRFALPTDMFHLVSSCETAKEIWERLRELDIAIFIHIFRHYLITFLLIFWSFA